MKIPKAGYAFITFCMFAGPGFGISNIDIQDTGRRYGWTENGGWTDLRGDTTSGVRVGVKYLQGFAWHENFGWINFGDGMPLNNEHYSNTSMIDFGVNVASDGGLSGYAWGENIGWIAFDTTGAGGARVQVEVSTGRFKGYAWGENIGWLSFETVDHAFVAAAPGYAKVRDWSLFY